MVVNPATPIRSINDLVAQARANPGKVHFGPALVGLLGGEISVMFENLPSALAHARSGKLRGIAVLSQKRSPSAPEFATTFELGVPELVIASSTGLLAPRGTPKEVVALLERTVRAIAADPEMVRTFSRFGADMDFLDAGQFRSYIDDEVKRWTVVGRRAQISVK